MVDTVAALAAVAANTVRTAFPASCRRMISSTARDPITLVVTIVQPYVAGAGMAVRAVTIHVTSATTRAQQPPLYTVIIVIVIAIVVVSAGLPPSRTVIVVIMLLLTHFC